MPDGATTEYQISNRGFSDFLRTYYGDFLSNVYRYGCIFCCDNGQCDAHPAGIAVIRSIGLVMAFVSSYYYFYTPGVKIPGLKNEDKKIN